jgi:hypothetical protein
MASEAFLKSLEVEGFTSKLFTDAGKIYYAATREFNGNGAMFTFLVRDMALCNKPSAIVSYHPHYGPAILWLMDRRGLDIFKPEITLNHIFGYIWRLADAPNDDLELLAANLLGRLRAQPGYSMEDECDIIARYSSNTNVAPDTAILALRTSPNPEFTKTLLLKLKDRFEETSSDKIKKEIFDKLDKVTIGKYYR